MGKPKYRWHAVNGTKPQPENELHRRFHDFVGNVDVPTIRFHDLRHTHATILMGKGMNPKVVSERLGHSNVSTTLDIYSHVLPSVQEEAAHKFGEALEAASHPNDQAAEHSNCGNGVGV